VNRQKNRAAMATANNMKIMLRDPSRD